MSELYKGFLKNTEAKVHDRPHFQQMKKSGEHFMQAHNTAVESFANHELAKQRAAHLRWKALENLEQYLFDFETQFVRRGGKVIWAQDADEAVSEIIKIFQKNKIKTALKSKTGTGQEIKLNKTLADKGIEVTETDLGDFVQQITNEESYHMVMPAIHKKKEDIIFLFNQQFGLPKDATPEMITNFVRTNIRHKAIDTPIGISGANFIVADIGGVAITENEGNAFITANFPKIHIVIAGIDKIISSMDDLELLWSLTSVHGTGQNITTYNTILTGPKQTDEVDGPEEMYVILLDNERSSLLEFTDQRKALTCIKCGACANVCPIYQLIGGHAYESHLSGPIANVAAPYLSGMKTHAHLSFASPLCGKCTDVCPVQIDLHKLMLNSRQHQVETLKLPSSMEKWVFYLWKKAMLKRNSLDSGSKKTKVFVIEHFFSSSWGKQREFPKLAPKSFNELWREQHPELDEKKKK